MPQDKRLIVTKALLHKLQRVCREESANDEAAAQEGVYLTFLLPTAIIAQVPELQNHHVFTLPRGTYARDGQSTCLIVPKVLSTDCFKINKRHGYYDAVVTAEAICRRDDQESDLRARRVAKTFAHFVVDSRIVSKLPRCIFEACRVESQTKAAPSGSAAAAAADRVSMRSSVDGSAGGAGNGLGTGRGNGEAMHRPCLHSFPRKYISALGRMDERGYLSATMSQGAMSDTIRTQKQGQLYFRVGHGGMIAGDICENSKAFVIAVKREFPTVWRYIHEFKLASNKTDSIRFMEVQIMR